MVPKREIELLLEPRDGGAVAPDPPEERLVTGVLGEGPREGVAIREVEPEKPEPLEQGRPVRVHHVLGVDPARVRAPLEEEVDEMPPPRPKGRAERRVGLAAAIVPVG